MAAQLACCLGYKQSNFPMSSVKPQSNGSSIGRPHSPVRAQNQEFGVEHP